MRSKLIEASRFIPYLRNSASFSVHNASLQKMYSVRCCTNVCVGGLCVSYLHNSEYVGVLSSLAGRNAQRWLLQQCMCGGLYVSYLGNPEFVDVHRYI